MGPNPPGWVLLISLFWLWTCVRVNSCWIRWWRATSAPADLQYLTLVSISSACSPSPPHKWWLNDCLLGPFPPTFSKYSLSCFSQCSFADLSSSLWCTHAGNKNLTGWLLNIIPKACVYLYLNTQLKTWKWDVTPKYIKNNHTLITQRKMSEMPHIFNMMCVLQPNVFHVVMPDKFATVWCLMTQRMVLRLQDSRVFQQLCNYVYIWGLKETICVQVHMLINH